MARIRGRIRRRKCRHCKRLYTVDYRNGRHQRYCTAAACRQASKRESQRRWLSSKKGRGYFHGPDHVARVRQWRAAHPGYWKRRGKRGTEALQDICSTQVIDKNGVAQGLEGNALQDVCVMQPALLVGLIATLTGSALQDDIAATSRRFIHSGRDILGMGVPSQPKGEPQHGTKARSVS